MDEIIPKKTPIADNFEKSKIVPAKNPRNTIPVDNKIKKELFCFKT